MITTVTVLGGGTHPRAKGGEMPTRRAVLRRLWWALVLGLGLAGVAHAKECTPPTERYNWKGVPRYAKNAVSKLHWKYVDRATSHCKRKIYVIRGCREKSDGNERFWIFAQSGKRPRTSRGKKRWQVVDCRIVRKDED